MNQPIIWLDGKFVPWNEANIHIMTHTLHYGSGAFEGIRCYDTDEGPAIFKLSEHVDRLLKSFSCFNVQCPWDKPTLEQAIIDTVKVNKFNNCYIRPLLFFGSESLLLSPKNLSVHCAIIALDITSHGKRDNVTVGISPIRRINPQAVPIHNKINGYYVNSIFAFHKAQERGFDEALLLDHQGNIAEGSTVNVFFVIDSIIKTPPSTSILPGITRASIQAIAQQVNIPIREEILTVSDIDQATEAFFTGTLSEIIPIKKIEQKEFSITNNTITQKIKSTYHDTVHGKDSSFKTWLTYII